MLQDNIYSDLESILKRIDELCSTSDDMNQECRSLLKRYFDYSVAEGNSVCGPLRELITENVDVETIWEQIQTRNRPLRRYFDNERIAMIKQLETSDSKKSSSELSEIVKYDDSSDGSEEAESEDRSGNESSQSDSGSQVDESEEDDDMQDANVDSEEFQENESDIEKWLDEAEEEEERHRNFLDRIERLDGHKGTTEEDSDDNFEEDEIAEVQKELYADNDSDEDEEGNELNSDDDDDDDDDEYSSNKKKGYRFSDFFGSSKSQSRPKKQMSRSHKSKRDYDEDEDDDENASDNDGSEGNSDSDNSEEDEDRSDEGSGSESNSDSDSNNGDSKARSQSASAMTSYAKKMQKLKEQIAQAEESAVGAKSWEYRGEISSTQRPDNSLLEVVVESDRISKSAPLVTQEYTSNIEDMIIARIKEAKFNDIVPVNNSVSTKDDTLPELSQEKSNVGLGDMYAEQFLKQSLEYSSGSKKIDKLRAEVLEQFHKVSRQLDALSHFHFTPKPVIGATGSGGAEAPMIQSIALEDITPSGEIYQSVGALAPEEIIAKKRDRESAMGTVEERTREEKRRLRQAKKAARRKDRKQKNITAESIGKESGKIHDKRVVEGVQEKGNDEVSYSKSASFFAKMQDQARSDIKTSKKRPNEVLENDRKNSNGSRGLKL